MTLHDRSASTSDNPITELAAQLQSIAAAQSFTVAIRLDDFEVQYVNKTPVVTLVPSNYIIEHRQRALQGTQRHLYTLNLTIEARLWAYDYNDLWRLLRWILGALQIVTQNNLVLTGGEFNMAGSTTHGRACTLVFAGRTELATLLSECAEGEIDSVEPMAANNDFIEGT